MTETPGEFELIAAIRERLEMAGAAGGDGLAVASGDDAAVAEAGGATVTSVDAVVDGVHFERRRFSEREIGHKALAAALSDLAAMGAEASEAYIQLLLPADIDLEACLDLADGIAALAAAHAVAVAGGDVTRAPALALAVTAIGRLPRAEDAITRSGARPGDAVVVTGELGGAAAGLLVLARPELAGGVEAEIVDALRRRQLAPEPRLAAGRALRTAGATAMIDVSDGLGADAAHVAEASGVAVGIELERLPVQAGVAEIAAAAGVDRDDLAAAGGEDYELLATIPAPALAEARAAVEAGGTGLTEIGSVGEGAGVELSAADGSRRSPAGYDQLAGRRGPGDRA